MSVASGCRAALALALAVLVTEVGAAGEAPAKARVAAPSAAATASALAVTSSSATASIPGAAMPMSVIYLTVRNGGAQADRLLGASTPAAKSVMLHHGSSTGSVAQMRDAAGFDVPAGGELRLATGGDHLMLMDLPQPLVAGSSLALVLHFQKAGDVKVVVPVVAPTGK